LAKRIRIPVASLVWRIPLEVPQKELRLVQINIQLLLLLFFLVRAVLAVVALLHYLSEWLWRLALQAFLLVQLYVLEYFLVVALVYHVLVEHLFLTYPQRNCSIHLFEIAYDELSRLELINGLFFLFL